MEEIKKLESRVSTIEKALGIDSEGELIGFDTALKLLEVQPATLKAYIAAKKIKPVKGRAAKAKFRKTDIDNFKNK